MWLAGRARSTRAPAGRQANPPDVPSVHLWTAKRDVSHPSAMGELYASYRDVTTEAAWSSDAPGVVQVASPATLSAGAPGDAHVNVTYQGAAAVGYFHVYSGEPIPWQFWPDAVTLV